MKFLQIRFTRDKSGQAPRAVIMAAVCAAWLMAMPSRASDDDLDFLFSDETPDASQAQTPSGDAGNDSGNDTPGAQDNPPAEPYARTIALPEAVPQATAPPRRGRVVEEIVVTAQKTEQTLQEVPVAVSVVDGDTLRDSGVFGAEGIENLVPNVELDTDAQAPTIGVRGFSTDSYNVGLEPSVGIIVDDISLGRTEFIPDGLFDINRVEVLRGPQGTLFGKNTIAGVLIFGTGDPHPESSGSVLLTAAQDNQQRLELVANQPLTDEFLSRVSAVSWKSDGEVANHFLERNELAFEQFGARVKASYDVSDSLQVRLGGQISDISTNYPNWQLFDVDPDALEYARRKDPTTEDNPYNQRTTFDLPGFVDHETELFHAAADYALGDSHDLTGIYGHATLDNRIRMDFDVSAADLARVNVHHTYAQDSLELRSSGSFSLFGLDTQYVGGLFAFASDMTITVDVALGEDIIEFGLTPAGIAALGGPSGLPFGLLSGLVPVPQADLGDGIFQFFDQQSRSQAAFGQLTVALTDRLGMVLGLRVGSEDKDAVLSITSRGPGLTALVVGANDPPDTDFSEKLERRETEISPKAGVQFEVSDAISTYASWTRGYKGGGFNAISFNSDNLVFEPERGDSFELGAKMRLLDESLALNTTLYHTIVSNMQVVNFNGVSFDVFNAAKSRLQGFEADARWYTPWEWLSINGALAISKAEYESYPEGPQTAEQSENCGPADAPDSANCTQNLTGKTLPKAPEFTASLSPTVSLPFGQRMGVVLGADVSWRGEQYLTLDLDEHGRQKAQLLIGARISFGPQDEAWGLTLRGSNITDEKALSFVADHNLYADSYFATQIPGRNLSLTFSANW